MREMTNEYVAYTLEEERLWKEKESDTFQFGDWTITLAKEEKIYYPFTYSIFATHENGHTTWSRRYTSMESAFLHILNDFNENVNFKNRYNSIGEYI